MVGLAGNACDGGQRRGVSGRIGCLARVRTPVYARLSCRIGTSRCSSWFRLARWRSGQCSARRGAHRRPCGRFSGRAGSSATTGPRVPRPSPERPRRAAAVIVNALALDMSATTTTAPSGDWSDLRECHVWPDLVLIYEKPDSQTLRLVRLGSHSELGLDTGARTVESARIHSE